MKKLLTAVLAAGLLTAVVCAEAPKGADFAANNGFYYGPNKSEVVQDEEHRSIPTVEEVADGVKVAHKGYYQTGDNCGGVHSTEKYDLNGLSVTLAFDLVPEVTTDTDCWFAIDFVSEPKGFYTNSEGNKGIEDLIRFGGNFIDMREASLTKNWESIYSSSGQIDADKAVAFGIKTGDVVTVKIDRTESGSYKMTYTNNDITIELPAEYDTVGDVFEDGKAYLCIVGSCELGDQDGFVYRITDVTNGVAMTEEEIAAIAAAKAEKELAEKTDAANKLIDSAKEALDKVIEEYAGYEAADALIAEGQEALDAAVAAVENGEFDAVQGYVDTINDKAVEAKNAGKKAADAGEEKKEAPAEGEGEGEENGENGEGGNGGEGEGEGNKKDNGWILWAIIGVVVVAAIVIGVVASKKKKETK